MYIKNVNMRNYRGYEKMTVEFKPGINLIIGNNGAGKSSLLAGIQSVLGMLFSTTKGLASLNHFQKNDVRISSKKIGDTTVTYERNYPMYVECELEYNDELLKIKRGVDDEASIEGGSLVGTNFYRDLVGDSNAIIPLVNYQRFDREWLRNNAQDKQLNIEIGPTDRLDGLKGTLDDKNIDDIISRWCLKMSMIEMERASDVHEFTVFKIIISCFLKHLMEVKSDVEVFYSIEQGGLVFKTDGVNQPIVNLSTGYRAVLSLVMELAYRIVVVNPTINSDLKNYEGIFLIDEIDAHLHPRWQWRILESLEQTFPSVQFIIATHSPMIISSAKNAHIVKIESLASVTYLPDAFGMSPDDILELRQGSINVPSEVKNIKDELDSAFMDEDVTKADEIMAKAEKKYGVKSNVYTDLKDVYDINTWMGKDE